MTTTPLPRRAALAGAFASALASGGCGFRPLYAPDGPGGAGVASELATIYVAVIPERIGQLLRQALQRRLEGPGEARAKQYEMLVDLGIAGEGIGIQQDNSATRIRLIGTARWTLRDLTPQRAVAASGAARALDGLNVLNQQYFNADLETEEIYRRIAENLATQIVQQVAVHLRRTRAAPAAT